MNANSKILVTGHNGLVGSAVVRQLYAAGFDNVITWQRKEVNLEDPAAVRWAFSCYEPEYVFHCAAKVGGIGANMRDPVGFFLQNTAIQNNVITEAARYKTKKLVFLGSSCIYPANCPQPIKEEYLLTGPLEKTNEAYALAKICGVKLCQWFRQTQGCDFVSAMPCNLYGPGDLFHAEDSHIFPGMMVNMHNAKEMGDKVYRVWGDGTQQRELLFSDDLARALIVVMEKYSDAEPINTGSSDEWDAFSLACGMAVEIGFPGVIDTDPSKPTGVRRKILDTQKLLRSAGSPA